MSFGAANEPRARRLPLHDEHTGLGGRMVETDGWLMPMEFTGVFQEYRAHHRSSVVWDGSNLGSIRVSGPDAYDLLQNTFTSDLRRCGVGRSQYAFLLSEIDASVVDDLMIWWVRDDLFYLTPNRGDLVLSALRRRMDTGPWKRCAVEDVSDDRVLLAVQGMRAADKVAELIPHSTALPAFAVREVRIDSGPALLATTGFARQRGFELHCPPASARRAYRRLVALGVTPAGVGMRETHRMEAGIPRHGFELGDSITPLELGRDRLIAFDTDFVGRRMLVRKQAWGVRKVLRGVVMADRRVPSRGAPLYAAGRPAGYVTSSTFSPRLHKGLALAFVLPQLEPGDHVTVHTGLAKKAGQLAALPLDLG